MKDRDMRPQGTQVFLDGLHYKMGVHNKWFYHTGFRWVLSDRPAHEIQLAIKSAELRSEREQIAIETARTKSVQTLELKRKRDRDAWRRKAEGRKKSDLRTYAGKTMHKYTILDALGKSKKPMTMNEMHKKTGVCRSSINRIIDTLAGQILRIEPSERAHPKMITWELIGSST